MPRINGKWEEKGDIKNTCLVIQFLVAQVASTTWNWGLGDKQKVGFYNISICAFRILYIMHALPLIKLPKAQKQIH